MSTPQSGGAAHRAWVQQARLQFDEADRQALLARNDPQASDSYGADSFPGYGIEHEIHRGGQGVVYAAVQRSTGRRVALKVLREGAFAGPLDRARFEREIQVLASLNHPGIVAIHDSGSAGGRFYFVMDLIVGQPLDVYLAGERRSVRETLELFWSVCEAVDAAHLRGIIHRDIKPGNVRIDATGKPYVLDFGLAKLVNSSSNPLPEDAAAIDTCAAGVTMTGQFLGSMPWAAPEQAEGSPTRIDTRTDVYALGVLLFQMLTGRFPYPVTGGMREVLEHIVKTPPQRPRALRREINDEIETIVLKCLSKERERRYQTAGELARDVRRYLNNEPIEAKRDSLAYVLRKGLSRHRTAVAASALVALVVVGAGVVSLALWRQAVVDRDAAVSAGRRADAEADTANAVTEFLQTMLSSAEPVVRQGRALTVLEVLDQAARDVDHGRLAGQPRVEATVRLTLGRAYLALGQLDLSGRQLEAAREFVARDNPSSTAHGEALRWLGVLARRRNQLEESERLQRQALDVYRRLDPPDPTSVGHSLGELALVVSLAGRRDESIQLTRDAVENYRRGLGPAHSLVASMESVLSSRVHDHAEALELAQRSLAALQAAYGERHPQVVNAIQRVGGALLARGDVAGAVEAGERALALKRDLYGDDNPDTLDAAAELAFLHGMRGDHEAATGLLEQFLAAADSTYGPCNELRYRYLIGVAGAHLRRGETAAAENSYRALLDSPDCPEWSTAMGGRVRLGLSELLLDRGASEEAATHLAQFQQDAAANPDLQSPAGLARHDCLWGEVLILRGELAEAERRLLGAQKTLSASRMAARSHRQRVVEALIRLYEAWDAAEPGTGKAERAAEWRAAAQSDATPSGPAR